MKKSLIFIPVIAVLAIALGIFVVAAILTPPDVISQFSLAIPLMALYEISILLVRYLNPDDRNDPH